MKEIIVTEAEVEKMPNDFELGAYIRKKMIKKKRENK